MEALIVFLMQILYSYLKTSNVAAVAEGKRMLTRIQVLLLSSIWLYGTFLGIEAIKANDWLTIVAYITGTLIGNEIHFILKNRK